MFPPGHPLMPAKPEPALESARDHLFRCEARVEKQTARIAALTTLGCDIDQAKRLLSALQVFVQIACLCVNREEEKMRAARKRKLYGRDNAKS